MLQRYQKTKHLKNTYDDTARLSDTLRSLHDLNNVSKQSALTLLHVAAPDNDWAGFDVDLGNLIERIEELEKAANNAIAALPEDRGGAPSDIALKTLITRLGGIYGAITGKAPTITYDDYAEEDAYVGPFYDFAKAVLDGIAPDRNKSNQGLGKFIQRSLNRMKTA